jgi:hypothetical protein
MNRHQQRVLAKQPRYQVFLETKDGMEVPHGPTAPKEFCERVCEGINRAFLAGKRSPLNITGAHIVPVPSH